MPGPGPGETFLTLLSSEPTGGTQPHNGDRAACVTAKTSLDPGHKAGIQRTSGRTTEDADLIMPWEFSWTYMMKLGFSG